MAGGMNIGWFWNRLRSMSPGEIGWRVRQLFRERLEKWLPPPRTKLNPGLPPGLGLPEAKMDSLQVDREACLRSAEKVLQGRISMFDLEDVEEGLPPDWHRDPRSGKSAPLRYSKDINYRSFEDCGDIKYVWEPSRHLELVTLARAFALTGEARFREGFKSRLESWWKQNPFNQGVHWCSSLELGIRLGNWALCADFLGRREGGLEGLGEDFIENWKERAFEHCHYIRKHLASGSSANNHLVGEVAGLFLGCAAFPFFSRAPAWRALARSILIRELEIQIHSDGVNKEQTTGYHTFIADFFLIPGVVARGSDDPFPETYWDRLQAMAEFSAALVDAGGNVAAIGDLDDGHMTRLCDSSDFHPHLSLVATMAVLRGRPEFAAKSGSMDEKTYWLTGEEGAGRWGALGGGAPASDIARAFPEGGYWWMGRDWESDDEVRLLFDCGPLGFLSLAAHGHADALSVQLSVGGREILVDAGNWCYFQEPAWRDYFKSTLAHNTLSVDGADQSQAAGMFLWTEKARATLLASERSEDGGIIRLEGEHDGYQRLADPVKHRRGVDWDSRSVFVIRDSVEARGSHRYSLAFHFAEGCEVVERDGDFVATHGAAKVRLSPPSGWEARLVKGQEDPPLGWRATRFMVRNPSPVVVLEREAEGNWECETSLRVE